MKCVNMFLVLLMLGGSVGAFGKGKESLMQEGSNGAELSYRLPESGIVRPAQLPYAEVVIRLDGQPVATKRMPILEGVIDLKEIATLQADLLKSDSKFAGSKLNIYVDGKLVDEIYFQPEPYDFSTKKGLRDPLDVMALESASAGCDAYCGRERRECIADCSGQNCTNACNARFNNCMLECSGGQSDEDSDDVSDSQDNCPFAYNPGQENCDGDEKGNVCDNFNGIFAVAEQHRCYVADRTLDVGIGSYGYTHVKVKDFWQRNMVDISACNNPPRLERFLNAEREESCYAYNSSCDEDILAVCKLLITGSIYGNTPWCISSPYAPPGSPQFDVDMCEAQ